MKAEPAGGRKAAQKRPGRRGGVKERAKIVEEKKISLGKKWGSRKAGGEKDLSKKQNGRDHIL